MKKGTIIGLSITLILLILGFVVFSSYRSVFDENVALKNQFKAQKGFVEVNLDGMKKILKDQAKLTDKQADKFKEIYVPIIEGRYSKGDGSLMKWITEQNPNFDQSNYNKLMNNIEALRKEFQQEQKKILAIKEQHDNLRESFWSRMFLGNEPELQYTIISSTDTKQIMDTGIDDKGTFD